MALIIIVILAALLSSTHGSGGPSPPANNTGQGQLLESLSAPGNQTTAGVISVSSQKLVSNGQFNVSYSGNASIQVRGGKFGNLEFQAPLRIVYEKYGGDSRLYFGAMGIPFIGNISSYEISLANGTVYSCSSPEGFSANVIPVQGFTCTASQSGGLGQYLSLLKSLQSNPGKNSTVKVLGNAQYDGLGCALTRVSGEDTETNYTVSYNATTCLSDQYYVPLNLTASARTSGPSGYNLSISLEEVSIALPVTPAEVIALPGPVNATQNLTSVSTTTVSSSTTTLSHGVSAPFVNGTTTCTPPYGNQNTNCLGFTMNQNRNVTISIETTDYNAYHISVGCEIDQYNDEFVNSRFPVYYAINSSMVNLRQGTVGAVNASGTASLLENTPLNFTGLPCSAEVTVPQILAPGSQVSGTIWFNYKSAPYGGNNDTGILASFNTTISKEVYTPSSTTTIQPGGGPGGYYISQAEASSLFGSNGIYYSGTASQAQLSALPGSLNISSGYEMAYDLTSGPSSNSQESESILLSIAPGALYKYLIQNSPQFNAIALGSMYENERMFFNSTTNGMIYSYSTFSDKNDTAQYGLLLGVKHNAVALLNMSFRNNISQIDIGKFATVVAGDMP